MVFIHFHAKLKYLSQLKWRLSFSFSCGAVMALFSFSCGAVVAVFSFSFSCGAGAVVVAVFVFMRCCGGCFRFHLFGQSWQTGQ